MTEDAEQGPGLAYTDNISIAWREVSHELDKHHLAMVNASNEAFLRDVNVMGDSTSPKDASEGVGAVAHEIARLDLKLNLVLDLVSTLIYHELDIPQTCPVRVAADEVSWRGDVPGPGKTVFLELYIQRGLPKPLCCYGKVVSTPEEHATGLARVRFVGLTGTARSWLEKLIFRHHRREIAFRRSTAAG
jgi:hypothetical protein